jgi:hypothetical protein
MRGVNHGPIVDTPDKGCIRRFYGRRSRTTRAIEHSVGRKPEVCGARDSCRRTRGLILRRVTDDPEQHLQAASRHEQAAANHDRSATFWERQGKREQADLQRELASYERHGAELERQWAELVEPKPAAPGTSATEHARGFIRENAQHLSSVLTRTTEALEKTAAIAEQHAQRRDRAGLSDAAAEERRAADRAREYAGRARSQAEEWFKLAGPNTE